VTLDYCALYKYSYSYLLNQLTLAPQPVARNDFFIGWADSMGVWVDSIRQVDVDLNFLLVLYRQYCRSISLSLFVRSTGYMLGIFFGWAEYIGCPPNVIVGWATAHLAP